MLWHSNGWSTVDKFFFLTKVENMEIYFKLINISHVHLKRLNTNSLILTFKFSFFVNCDLFLFY